MRISAKIMADHIKANLARQSTQMMETHQKLVSGKRINKPSDDPGGMGKVLDYRKTLSSIEQYRENILTAKTRLEFSESILGEVGEFIEQAKDIATNPGGENRSPFIQQIRNIREQVLGLANQRYGQHYLFAGHLSGSPPFGGTSPYAYNGDAGSHHVMVGEGITIQVEADGSQMFIDGTDNLFQVLEDLETALATDPFDLAAVEATVDPLYRIADRLELTRSELAADYKRMERTDDHWKNFANAVETMRQTVEDADIAQAAVDMQVQQTNYEVLLATAGQIIQPTLVDFLG
ncbi:MAG: flagellar hook-associated protein 3 [Deltaproteobacteria bacterium]|nr:MAG: flagellar hook-associated protein 3 [Deltaproteobacteria bacterium]